MKQLKNLLLCLLPILLLGVICLGPTLPHSTLGQNGEAPIHLFQANQKSFETWKDGTWTPIYLSGVNMGASYPGAFPGDSDLDYDTYLRWFTRIADMNANTIRVYQLQTPAFYVAFAAYNQTHEVPLYLIQGIDFPDTLMYSEKNLLDSENTRDLFSASRNTVDALHGNKVLLDGKHHNLHFYTADVSPYLLGYTLGVEWDELFIHYVCSMNPDEPAYSGDYFRCDLQAAPFESFLARWADEVLSYESSHYALQPMISFANWAETDPLINNVSLPTPNASHNRNKWESTVDIEHIHPTEANHSGIFASYNIYPYFPEFLQYGPYTQFLDKNGNRNPYQGYLKELVEHHSYPVLISEYGVPACRSTAYQDIWRGYSHGGLNELEQAQAVVDLYQDIRSSGCAGSLVFTWQDEWFKRAWNEMMLSDPDQRAFWSNAQCAEQAFGLLSFDPGTPDTIVHPDGDLSDWTPEDLIIEHGTTCLSVKSDERYLYLLAEGIDTQPGHTALNLAFDITPKSGAATEGIHHFERPVDFLLQINQTDGLLRVHAPYDVMIYSMTDKLHPSLNRYSLDEMWAEYLPEKHEDFRPVVRAKGSLFTMINRHYDLEPVGILKSGNTNPDSPDYDSNADFCFAGDDAVEIRIPWQLLNFYAPSQCTVIDDLEENDYGIHGLKIDAIYAAVYADGQEQVTDFGTYKLKGWDKPEFHERLKPAYYALQKAFREAAYDHP